MLIPEDIQQRSPGSVWTLQYTAGAAGGHRRWRKQIMRWYLPGYRGGRLRRCRPRALILVMLLASVPQAVASGAGAASPGTGGHAKTRATAGIVRWDWYFRQSLVAIDHWETILASRQAAGRRDGQIPVLPVPSDGRSVEWPSPIPLVLLPPADRKRRISVRVAGPDRLEVRRCGSNAPGGWRSVPTGERIVGYQHPGGGGRDQWYHRYDRRFDRLTRFIPRTAPIALHLRAPLDWSLGENHPVLTLENVTDRPLKLAVRLQFFSPPCADAPDADGTTNGERRTGRAVSEQTVRLPGRSEVVLRFSVELTRPGGGLAIVTIDGAGQTYWLPLFTFIEDVPGLLEGVARILQDAPCEAASRELAELRRRARAELERPHEPGTWRQLFERVSALRDRLLLARIDFDQLLFVKRKPYYSEQPFMDGHHCYNRPGGAIYRLSPVRPYGQVTPVVDSLGVGIYRDLYLHWDADRLLFAFGNGSDRFQRTTGLPLEQMRGKRDYDIYEVCPDGTGLRQLTRGPKNDCEPFYLPNGRVGFTSDRSEHYVMCGSDIHVANLFVMNADGSDVRQLSSNVFNEFNPSVLPDGRIIYNRWEYNERSVTSLHDLFTMRPDGTHAAPFYGNATIRPNVIMFPRAVPGSHKVMALFTGHHGQTHGPIGLINVRRGVDGPAPITLLTPGVPVIGERIEDSRRGWYSDPMPLDERTYLCSYTPTVLPWLEASWAIYVGDRHGNLALVYRDPEISCAEPVPIVRRPRPPVLAELAADTAPDRADRADRTDSTDRTEPVEPVEPVEPAEASLLLIDVCRGLPGVPRRRARYLRILEDVPRKGVPTGGVICTSGTQIYTVKRILGTVPIETDGSACFLVPANRNVYFQVLDEAQREIQRMRSVVCLKSGEQRTCIGCHEPRMEAPPSRPALASSRPPSRPVPPPWGERTISFLRDVQPIINEHCAGCHTHDRSNCGVILTDDLTDQFTVAYEELLPYLAVANAMRWDHPDDVYPQPPYTYGSNASPLTRLLLAGHHGVELSDREWEALVCWIDANGVYYDRYETYTPDRHIFTGAVGKQLESLFARRCARCHGSGDGHYATWWLSINRRDVTSSRALRAPLARSAGGWQRCDEVVFPNTDDPDYRQLLALLGAVRDSLQARPRADLRSIRGTPAERQRVALPEPPPPRRQQRESQSGQWVFLSHLPWQSATAGWTRTGDGLPRRGKDVEDKPLRLGLRIYPHGLGTHAPSEIVYAIDGRYVRFTAVVGGAERNGTVVFQVYGDDKLLYQSDLMHGLRGTRRIDVSVVGVRRLRLVVTDGGDGYTCDMANWADARLLRAGKTMDRQ
ncbi:MAG TPA: hypothetical protein EYP56_11920 [Planctomycetaceae bacterium]|nr:hypothetical protein [Planctomycetaceae bacterium]